MVKRPWVCMGKHPCDDCGETFSTLSRLRLHNCTPRPSSDPTGDEFEYGDSFEEEGSIETWGGESEFQAEGTVSEEAAGKDCACCGSPAVTTERATHEWEQILYDLHDEVYAPIGTFLIPACGECSIKLLEVAEQETELYAYDEDARQEYKDYRENLLGSLDPDKLMDTGMMEDYEGY